MQEMERLEEGANVFKMMGPVLVKQDLEESKQNVQKRIDYINGEMCVIFPICQREPNNYCLAFY